MRALAFPLRRIVRQIFLMRIPPPPRVLSHPMKCACFVLHCWFLHIDQVEQETALLKETVEGATKVLAEAAATTKTATETSKQASVV